MEQLLEQIKAMRTEFKEGHAQFAKEFGVEIKGLRAELDEMKARREAADAQFIKANDVQTLVKAIIEAQRELTGRVLSVDGGYSTNDYKRSWIKRDVGGSLSTEASQGLFRDFLCTASPDGTLQEFQALSSRLTYLRAWMRRKYPDWLPATSTSPTVKRWWNTYLRVAKETMGEDFLARAFDTTEASEWVATVLATDLVRYMELRGGALTFFRTFAMPNGTYDVPISTAAGKAHLLIETTAYPAAAFDYTTAGAALYADGSNPVSNRRFDAVTMRTFIGASRQFIEESVIPMIDFAVQDTADGIRRAIEDAMFNGDDTSPGFETGFTYTGAIRSNRNAWNGLRCSIYSGADPTGTAAKVDASGTLDWTHFGQAYGKLGRYGTNPAMLGWFCGPIAYSKLLLIQNLATIQNYGADATLVKGAVDKILGAPLFVSDYMREDLNASGVYDNSVTTKTQFLVARQDAWWLGQFRGIETEPERIAGWDMDVIWARWRGDFVKVRPDADTTEASIFNITK